MTIKKMSNLGKNKELATTIYNLSEGLIGEVKNLLTAAAIYSIKNGKEKITKEVLASIGWVRPSRRRKKPYEI